MKVKLAFFSLIAALFVTLAPAQADCLYDYYYQREVCNAGMCLRADNGQVACATAFFGQCVRENSGAINCGAGQCILTNQGYSSICSGYVGGRCYEGFYDYWGMFVSSPSCD